MSGGQVTPQRAPARHNDLTSCHYPLLRAVPAACLYTHAPDADFVIGADPRSGRILIASACSGHGFKHSAAVGELLARMLLEGAAPPAPFRLDRGAMQTG